MPAKSIEVIIRGSRGTGTFNAAHAAAKALEAAGALVDLRSPLTDPELASNALQGVSVTVSVEDQSTGAEPLRLVSGAVTSRRYGISDLGKAGIGLVLLLMLFGAELRLHFGLRLDTILTLAGIWTFWHFCVRRGIQAA